ncbi:MAG: hypothetical protein WED01_08895 [Candidatus Rokuibacteriota bacterium]
MPAVVGIANTNEDLIELLRIVLEQEGSGTAVIRADFNDFVERHDPAAIIFDVPPPYDDHWTVVSTLRRLPVMQDRGAVITTTHKAHRERLVGESTGALEIIGKPNDMRDVLEAVKRELRRIGRLGAWGSGRGS